MDLCLDTKLSDIGEYAIHKWLRNQFQSHGILGDSLENDCAVFLVDGTHSLMSISTDFVPSNLCYRDFGRFLVIQNVSDVLSSGAIPEFILLGLKIPREFTLRDLLVIVEGVVYESARYGVKVIGGDTKESNELGGYGICLGRNRCEWRRNNTHPNDAFVVTMANRNSWAWRWAALLVKFLNLKVNDDLQNKLNYKEDIIELPYDILLRLQEVDGVNAAMDLSDGLGAALKAMSEGAQDIGVVLDCCKLEELLSPDLYVVAQKAKIPLWSLAFSPGYHWQTALAICSDKLDVCFKKSSVSCDGLVNIGKFVERKGFFVEHKQSGIVPISVEDDEKFKKYPWETKVKTWLDWARCL